MKPLKPSSRLSKTARGRSPMKKLLPSKKGHLKSPHRDTSNIRPLKMRGPSPVMKRVLAPPSSMRSRSPRHESVGSHRRSDPRRSHGSPVSMDRVHSVKQKYGKRSHSPSPQLRHRLPSPQPKHLLRPHGPMHSERQLNTRSPPYTISPKKKKQRELQRPLRNSSPSDIAISRKPGRGPAELHASRRGGSSSMTERISPGYFHDQNRGSDYYPPPPGRSSGSRQELSREGFATHGRGMGSSVKSAVSSKYSDEVIDKMIDSYSRGRIPPPSESYASSRYKRNSLTLDERFRGVSDSHRNEPRVRYSREDLEKITIDITRSTRGPSPTVRRIVNPSDVKLVRRPAEGHRPIFDREEIKRCPRDMREDAYIEQKVYSGQGTSHRGFNSREIENYEITRHKFDAYHGYPPPSSSTRTLNDRWQKMAVGKSELNPLDKDDRGGRYAGKPRDSESYHERSRAHRSNSLDRDFRQDRFNPDEGKPVPQRLPYSDARKTLQSPPRRSLSGRYKDDSFHDSRQHSLERRNSGRDGSMERDEPQKYWSSSGANKRIPENLPERKSGSSKNRDWWQYEKSSDRIKSADERLPDFSQRPERFKYQSWLEKPESTPKGSSYYEWEFKKAEYVTQFKVRRGDLDDYEHDTREDFGPPSRGSGRTFRGRGFRGRSFRGTSPRGSTRGRGSFRPFGNSNSGSRGRGYAPRRGGRYSPGHWEHDMFSREMQDRRSDKVRESL